MYKLYHTDKNEFITYNKCIAAKKNLPLVIFLHGLMSDMNGTKALFFENYCKKHYYNYVKFDNFGHGKSSGEFLNQTISSWLMGFQLILEQIVKRPAIIIGSSMGAWIAILAALKFPDKVKSLICLAPAIDFTEELIWQKLSDLEKKQMEEQGWLEVGGEGCHNKYPIAYPLILEARNHLLLNLNNINLNIPIHLIHGMLDVDVPYTISTRLARKITGDNLVIKLIKNGDHKLAQENDLVIMGNSLNELINLNI
jgi:hypothetical protein